MEPSEGNTLCLPGGWGDQEETMDNLTSREAGWAGQHESGQNQAGYVDSENLEDIRMEKG